jgi:hypothetical protein
MSHKMIILTTFGGVLLVGMACSFPVLISGPTSTPPQDRSALTGTASPVVIGLPLPKPEPAAGTVMTWIDNSDFVYVPSSEFIMGVDRPEGGDDTPAHHVDLAGFWIHQAEVTNGQYTQMRNRPAICSTSRIVSSPLRRPVCVPIRTGPVRFN